MKHIIGTTKVITFCTYSSTNELDVKTAHIALLLTFKDEELFDQYIAGNFRIPHKVKINPKDNTKYYEVYFSLGKENDFELHSRSSILGEYDIDRLFIPKIDDWGDFNHLYEVLFPINPIYTNELSTLIKQWKLNAKEIESIKSYGAEYMLPFMDTTSKQEEIFIPFVTKNSSGSSRGLNLEATLKYIANVANYPKDFPHEIFGENHARMPLCVLQAGLQLQPSFEMSKQLEQSTSTSMSTPNILIFSKPAVVAPADNRLSARKKGMFSLFYG